MRLRTDFWIGALLRRAQAEGAFVAVARRGASEAGAIFVAVDRRDGTFDLYGPAPQTELDGSTGGRLFSQLLPGADETKLRERIAQEVRFDSDLWLVEIEDRQGRHFLDLARDEPR